jgi:hypothetical protein
LRGEDWREGKSLPTTLKHWGFEMSSALTPQYRGERERVAPAGYEPLDCTPTNSKQRNSIGQMLLEQILSISIGKMLYWSY